MSNISEWSREVGRGFVRKEEETLKKAHKPTGRILINICTAPLVPGGIAGASIAKGIAKVCNKDAEKWARYGSYAGAATSGVLLGIPTFGAVTLMAGLALANTALFFGIKKWLSREPEIKKETSSHEWNPSESISFNKIWRNAFVVLDKLYPDPSAKAPTSLTGATFNMGIPRTDWIKKVFSHWNADDISGNPQDRVNEIKKKFNETENKDEFIKFLISNVMAKNPKNETKLASLIIDNPEIKEKLLEKLDKFFSAENPITLTGKELAGWKTTEERKLNIAKKTIGYLGDSLFDAVYEAHQSEVADKLAKLAPSFIFLQEVTEKGRPELSKLGEKYKLYHGEAEINDTCIMLDTEQFEEKDIKPLTFNEEGWSKVNFTGATDEAKIAFKRDIPVQFSIVTAKKDGQQYVFVSTHTEGISYGKETSPDSPTEQRRQLHFQLVHAYIEANFPEYDQIIMGGDFNTHPETYEGGPGFQKNKDLEKDNCFTTMRDLGYQLLTTGEPTHMNDDKKMDHFLVKVNDRAQQSMIVRATVTANKALSQADPTHTSDHDLVEISFMATPLRTSKKYYERFSSDQLKKIVADKLESLPAGNKISNGFLHRDGTGKLQRLMNKIKDSTENNLSEEEKETITKENLIDILLFLDREEKKAAGTNPFDNTKI